jgi:hypothetical protein
MKTPMQKLIEELKALKDSDTLLVCEQRAYQDSIDEATRFLEQERDALQEKYADGWADAFESYFFKRFKKNLETSPEI